MFNDKKSIFEEPKVLLGNVSSNGERNVEFDLVLVSFVCVLIMYVCTVEAVIKTNPSSVNQTLFGFIGILHVFDFQ